MNSFQADAREDMRPDLLRKDKRWLRHQRQPADGERPPPEDEELLAMFEEVEGPDQADHLREVFK